ncbi:hypothetical protein Q7A_03440 [Methylophaga nitratireducenticrescens]|uniref:hypothetical protein n=1 Tax=Methylophaga nitratireducenticrescens TaxID=754476 RepID=UPI000B7AC18E|nr:hypothetical protein [Methylophaga nitratireducenticrescens]ASF49097.1 hypothetical protein Q7A_03440 [Methylophaga nitratireducenticrescens]
MEEDVYIKALKFAEKKRKFTLQELQLELNLTNEKLKEFALQTHHNEIFYNNTVNFYTVYNKKPPYPSVYFSVKDKFRLIQYEELKEARKASKNATLFAVAALMISFIGSASAIYFNNSSSKQLDTLIAGLTYSDSELHKHVETIQISIQQNTESLNLINELIHVNNQINQSLITLKNEIVPTDVDNSIPETD